jgi:hypothetical protein
MEMGGGGGGVSLERRGSPNYRNEFSQSKANGSLEAYVSFLRFDFYVISTCAKVSWLEV